MRIPKHKGSFSIEHNPHRGNYESVKEYLGIMEDLRALDVEDFPSPEARQRCIDTDELWLVRWYPDTPVGSKTAAGSTLREALEFANNGEPTEEVDTGYEKQIIDALIRMNEFVVGALGTPLCQKNNFHLFMAVPDDRTCLLCKTTFEKPPTIELPPTEAPNV